MTLKLFTVNRHEFYFIFYLTYRFLYLCQLVLCLDFNYEFLCPCPPASCAHICSGLVIFWSYCYYPSLLVSFAAMSVVVNVLFFIFLFIYVVCYCSFSRIDTTQSLCCVFNLNPPPKFPIIFSADHAHSKWYI